jgi:proline iminopeptidase
MPLPDCLFPETKPFDEGLLPVSALHTLHYERLGNPAGVPVVILHGGPGAGIIPALARYYDPAVYHIVQYSQRGCGKSTPHTDLTDNTTPHLVADLHALRRHLNIGRWQVRGHSWGSTLALAYAQAHPDEVTCLVLSGIFLCRKAELRWFYQEGASFVYPEAFAPYRDFIPPAERHDLIGAYHRRLTSGDPTLEAEAARRWTAWETHTSYHNPANVTAREEDPVFARAFARIECHYFHNGIFLDDGQLLRDMPRIAHLPGAIFHGRYDMVCPYKDAWDLKQAWPKATLYTVTDGGHSMSENPTASQAILDTTTAFAAHR